tara:strand:+ start:268 stop:489 length:222 start_codon:yes stop_codon:yes gene_type:complete
MATIIAAKANNLKMNRSGFNLGRIPTFEKPFILEILRDADNSLRLKKYQRMASGSNKSNQKNSGFANDIFSNI